MGPRFRKEEGTEPPREIYTLMGAFALVRWLIMKRPNTPRLAKLSVLAFFQATVALAILPLAMAQETTSAANKSKPSIQNLPYTLPVKVGDTRSEVVRFLGEPTSSKMLPNFDPPVMTEVEYIHLGLKFSYCRNQIYAIMIGKPFDGNFYGLKIGDPISKAIGIFGDHFRGSPPFSRRPTHFYRWKDLMPRSTMKVYVEESRSTVPPERNPIVGFSFTDWSKRGDWLPVPR